MPQIHEMTKTNDVTNHALHTVLEAMRFYTKKLVFLSTSVSDVCPEYDFKLHLVMRPQFGSSKILRRVEPLFIYY